MYISVPCTCGRFVNVRNEEIALFQNQESQPELSSKSTMCCKSTTCYCEVLKDVNDEFTREENQEDQHEFQSKTSMFSSDFFDENQENQLQFWSKSNEEYDFATELFELKALLFENKNSLAEENGQQIYDNEKFIDALLENE